LKIEGTGSCVSVSTARSEVDAAVALYEGECGNLSCLQGSVDFGELLFSSELGKTYMLFVSGYLERGNFEIIVMVRGVVCSCMYLDNPYSLNVYFS
jgi:hypothetical protein